MIAKLPIDEPLKGKTNSTHLLRFYQILQDYHRLDSSIRL